MSVDMAPASLSLGIPAAGDAMAVYSQNALLGTAVALPLLGVVAVALRFYVRLRVRRTFIGADDWLVLLAVVLVCYHGVNQILVVEYGVAGQDDTLPKDLDTSRIVMYQKLTHAVVVIEKVTYAAIKLSVLCFYRRIFGSGRAFRRLSDVLIVLVLLWAVVFIFVESFTCTGEGGSSITCGPQQWALLWFAITEVLGDIVILSLPYPHTRKLQMSKTDKVGLIVIFALGTISTITGIIRLGYVAKSFYYYFHPDRFYDTSSAPPFWTTVEVSVGVLAACLPPLGPLLRLVPGPRAFYDAICSAWPCRTCRRAPLTGGGSSSKPTVGNNRRAKDSTSPRQLARDGVGGGGGGGGKEIWFVLSNNANANGERTGGRKEPQTWLRASSEASEVDLLEYQQAA